MIFKEQSDITKVTSGIIAHGVNRQRRMGTGVAKALYLKWGTIKNKYLHELPMPELGSAKLITLNDNLVVFNCYTQDKYGYDGAAYATKTAIIKSLDIVVKYAKQNSIPYINIPRIGCKRGGLRWDELQPHLLLLEDKTNRKVQFIVHNYKEK